MSNKYIKNYYTNTTTMGKNANKPYYASSSNIYLDEIYKINKDINDGIVPINQILENINILINKYKLIFNYANDNSYLILLNLLKIIQENVQIINLNNEIAQLMEQIEILENTEHICTCSRSGFTFDPIDTNINTTIKLDYTYYIKTCGIPNDGIYLQNILDIISNYVSDINYLDIELESIVNIISEKTSNAIIIINGEKKVLVYNHYLI